MKILSIIALIIAVVIGCVSVTVLSSNSPCQHYHEADFDYFLLSIQWPGNSCKINSQHKDCRVPASVSNFTIHGLWPNSNTIYHGPTCCQDIPFDYSALKPIMQSLEVNWPSFFNTNEDFWSHEWLKHGTCSQSSSEYDYFFKTLNLLNRLPLLNALSKAGIVPGKSMVSTSAIVSAIKDQLRIPVQLTCGHGNYLNEVHMCLTKQFEFIECPASQRVHASSSDACQANVYFLPLH